MTRKEFLRKYRLERKDFINHFGDKSGKYIYQNFYFCKGKVTNATLYKILDLCESIGIKVTDDDINSLIK